MTDLSQPPLSESRELVPIRGAGGKSGGKSRQPIETADSLHSVAYAQILDLVSEGEIVGVITPDWRGVLVNGTPVQNADLTYNYAVQELHQRTGTQFQDVIPGFPASQQETLVGIALEQGTDWTYSITNTQLSAVRIRLAVAALSKLLDNGDLVGNKVDYEIAVQTDGGPWINRVVASFDGKTTQLYERSHRIDLPPAATGWFIRVRRTTPNSASAKIQDATSVQSITSIIDANLRYPMSALFGWKIDARQFSSIPTRAYHLKGRIIQVPSNYNAAARTYDGLWNGTFQPAYTNNPAWVFLDLITHDRYGLGEYIALGQVDKWALYRIAVYCDDMVDDGRGGLEPRFTCNAYLQSRTDAWKLLQDLASIFRGIAYYAVGTVFASADIPTDPVYTFTAANVTDGVFEYQGSPRTSRATVALVSWNDLTDLGRAKVEAVDDPDGIARLGIQQIELTAFGCTSQAQARRVGKWALLTSRLETDVVSFSVGLDGALCVPGQIIRIADPNRSGRRVGGRIRSATTTSVTTDADVIAAYGDRLTVILPTGVAETRTITTAVGDPLTIDQTDITADATVTAAPAGDIALTIDRTGLPATTATLGVSPPFSAAPVAGAIWTVESSLLYAQTFRVVSVAERGGITFDVSAIQHEPGKYDAVDYGTIIQERPISVVPPGVQAPPASVALSSYYVIEQGIANSVMRITWPAPDKAVAYDVEWRRDNGDWVRVGSRVRATAHEVRGIYKGAYLARVRAINALDVLSIPTTSVETLLEGKVDPPPVVSFLQTTSQVFAIRVRWGFPNVPLDLERTEIWYSTTNNRANAVKLGDFAFPQDSTTLFGLSAGVEFWFWARLVDKSGNLGAFEPIGAGIYGQSSAQASEILDYLAGQITATQLGQQLLGTIEGAEGSVVAIETIENDLAALYTIKTQINANDRVYIAGIGVGVENNAGIVESQVLVAADRFAVIDPNGATVQVPFVIQGGQVFMDSAFIQNASITDAKIVSLSATKIVATALSAITANVGTLTAGILQNSANPPSFVMNLSATGSNLLMRAGDYTYYGPYAGAHYPVEIYANGQAFFGRDVVSGGAVRASGTYDIPSADRPGFVFSAAYSPPTDSAGP